MNYTWITKEGKWVGKPLVDGCNMETADIEGERGTQVKRLACHQDGLLLPFRSFGGG